MRRKQLPQPFFRRIEGAVAHERRPQMILRAAVAARFIDPQMERLLRRLHAVFYRGRYFPDGAVRFQSVGGAFYVLKNNIRVRGPFRVAEQALPSADALHEFVVAVRVDCTTCYGHGSFPGGLYGAVRPEEPRELFFGGLPRQIAHKHSPGGGVVLNRWLRLDGLLAPLLGRLLDGGRRRLATFLRRLGQDAVQGGVVVVLSLALGSAGGAGGSDASDALKSDEAAAPSSEKAVVASAPSTPPVLAVFFFLAIGARARFAARAAVGGSESALIVRSPLDSPRTLRAATDQWRAVVGPCEYSSSQMHDAAMRLRFCMHRLSDGFFALRRKPSRAPAPGPGSPDRPPTPSQSKIRGGASH